MKENQEQEVKLSDAEQSEETAQVENEQTADQQQVDPVLIDKVLSELDGATVPTVMNLVAKIFTKIPTDNIANVANVCVDLAEVEMRATSGIPVLVELAKLGIIANLDVEGGKVHFINGIHFDTSLDELVVPEEVKDKVPVKFVEQASAIVREHFETSAEMVKERLAANVEEKDPEESEQAQPNE